MHGAQFAESEGHMALSNSVRLPWSSSSQTVYFHSFTEYVPLPFSCLLPLFSFSFPLLASAFSMPESHMPGIGKHQCLLLPLLIYYLPTSLCLQLTVFILQLLHCFSLLLDRQSRCACWNVLAGPSRCMMWIFEADKGRGEQTNRGRFLLKSHDITDCVIGSV